VRREFLIGIIAFLLSNSAIGQVSDTVESSKLWSITAAANLYFVPSDFFILPIVRADRNWLHLESRYNYEDRNTVSVWGGYNFEGGKEFTYALTPMLGGVVGNTDGIAPGLEITLDYKRFIFYSESEYLFEFSGSENHFFYVWTELGFQILKPFSAGVLIQRTKAFKSDFEVQRGLWAAYNFKHFTVQGYVFNPFSSDSYGILSLQYEF
jgi:hypothetical protein